MKLNSTENIHGILQGFSTLTEHATDSCRTALHNGKLYCVYLGEGGKIMYMIKSPSANWGTPTPLLPASARDGYKVTLPMETPTPAEYFIASDNTPSLVSFNNQLWLIYTDEDRHTVFQAWDESNATFLPVRQRALSVQQSAAFANINNTLHMFYKLHDSPNIYCIRTTDMEHWDTPFLIKKDGITAVLSNLSPVAITYQGLIHLIYKDRKGGFFLLKSDGENWTSAIPLIGADYAHSPGIAVHNGLLKLIFCNLSNTPSTPLYQYNYDGNSLSPVVASTMLNAGGSPALNTLDGKLIATYLESAPIS